MGDVGTPPQVKPRVRRSTTARGYGHHHQQVKKQLGRVVASGSAICTRCGEPIGPLELWDLDHRDDRRGYLGAAHRGCNRSAGAKKGNAGRGRRVSVEFGEPRRVSRGW